ncbi:formyl-CoA transferase [Mycobacterium nebraskense]|uniref:Formyl-CoA transferase n=1 Tax=Mycobacterium nebraskense TaxID=244292 RepID=A0A1X1ZJK1_9MYCO|nr:CaiB/BaiF CoA-transferase family protein [Mycobacterium nebraskense]KKC05070.1 formyl-CoA transferase [Mycobacterium nebraskense]MCV7117153.1 CoA transferase [Mycobacterium nebraskense]ORW23539.1 formyl-CoA transferase [Mycobacterium nebraskense]
MLNDVRVLELSLFSPDALGGHLADLGAEVIKIEQPGGGGFRGELFPPDNVQNLQWNRGKKSVTLNLKSEKGMAIFRRLAAEATVVIDGLRAGAAERLGLGYDDLVELNPTIVYCSLNGMGSYGPYAKLPTHGLSFDCFAGLNPPLIEADGTPRLSAGATGTTGVLAGPLYAAMAVLAALHSARRDGRAQYVEVSQVDAAIAWNFQRLTAHANGLFGYSDGVHASLRYQYYETGDGNYVVFNALEDKFWRRFCEAVDRMDLYELGRARLGDDPHADEHLRSELTAIFKSRSRREWTDFFIATDIAGAPAFESSDLLDDEHVAARHMVYEPPAANRPPLRLIASPIKTKPDHPFAAALPPTVGAHTDEVLTTLAGCDETELAELHRDGVI